MVKYPLMIKFPPKNCCQFSFPFFLFKEKEEVQREAKNQNFRINGKHF